MVAVVTLGAATPDADYRRTSYWHETVPGSLEPRRPLQGDVDVDVAVVGAGYTGLWTAYYLLSEHPGLRVGLIERDVAGFGASGRNGGWCSGLFPVSLPKVARLHGRDGALALQSALWRTVDEVGRAAAAEGIDCHYAKGGTVVVARSGPQLQRARDEVARAREWGATQDDLRLLDAAEARAMVGATDVVGGTYTPHCAALHPARLARGLAEAVERRGASLWESTQALRIDPGVVTTDRGTVRASRVVRATEGYTPRLPGLRRRIAPVYSLMLATEPLTAEQWSEVGLRDRQVFADHRHLTIYGQRTADGRLAFGGRGAPYHLASRVHPSFDREPEVFADLRSTLVELFPVLAGTDVTHTWGGPLGIPRDWFPSVGFDRTTGLAWAGGYVGDGVAASNLAGRTLAHLLLGIDSELTALPWVGHRSRSWEPEPLRWLGINLGLRAMGSADDAERRSGRSSRRAALAGRLVGR